MSSNSAETASNPLLATSGLPKFDLIRAEHVVPGIREMLATANQKLAELEKAEIPETWEGLFGPLEEISRLFERSWGAVGHLFGTLNTPDLRAAYEEVQPEVVTFSLKLTQSRPIYDAMRRLKDGSGWDGLNATQRRILDSRLLDAELSGIGLPDDKRARFNEIKQKLSKISTEFSNHVLDATNAWSLLVNNKDDAKGLPLSFRRLAAESYNEHKPDDLPEANAENGPWRVTLEASSFVPFMQHCKVRSLREQVYRAFITRASEGGFDNSELCIQILKLRKELAALLGYETYADVSLAEKMAPNVNAVLSMLEQLRSASWDNAVQDLDDIRAAAKAGGQTANVQHWDVAFWAERIREQRYEISDEQVRPYFPHETVLAGMFDLVERIFGINVRSADGKAPVWHKDARYFEIDDAATGKTIAAFYYDPYSRPATKRPGAWMDECLNRRTLPGGELQIPVAHLVCNSTPPTKDVPSLMSFREVETLFHEFGHGLQHMLTTVDHPEAAGINNVEWDAVELASQFMENWCYHRPTVDKITGHYETGEPLPDDLFQKLVAARTYRAGSDMLRQLTFGLTDMTLHTEFDPDGTESIFDVQERIMAKTSPLGMFENDRFLCSFSHIFAGGYAAGYYSYKWAEVLSADAFSAFEDAGLDDADAVAKIGRRFRDTVLALGGSRDPMDVFESFRGRGPSTDALLRHNGLLS